MKKQNYNKIFVALDIHETIMKPTWSCNLSENFYKYAKKSLQLLSKNKNVCLIIWSCSTDENNVKYKSFFKENNIHIDYINENPEIKSEYYANFETKLYFDVGMDDKFGFKPKEWFFIYYYLILRNLFKSEK